VEADLNLCRSTPATRHLKYRNIKAIDPVRFAALIRDQEIFTSPPDDVNAFADMLDASVMRVLDVLAPIRTRTVRVGKRSARWLSTSATSAKRKRRLERRWKRTRSESDRLAFRAACRQANSEINRSREAFFLDRLASAGTNQKAKWRVVRELLHADDQSENQSPSKARRLCTDFARFVTGKLCRVAAEVAARMSTTAAISVALPLRPRVRWLWTLYTLSALTK